MNATSQHFHTFWSRAGAEELQHGEVEENNDYFPDFDGFPYTATPLTDFENDLVVDFSADSFFSSVNSLPSPDPFDSSDDDDDSPDLSTFLDPISITPPGNIPNLDELVDHGHSQSEQRPLSNKRPDFFRSFSAPQPNTKATVTFKAPLPINSNLSPRKYTVSSLSKSSKKDKASERKCAPVRSFSYCSTNVQSAILGKLTINSASSDDSEIESSGSYEFSLRPTIKHKTNTPRTATATVSSDNAEIGKDIDVDLENFETEVERAAQEAQAENSLMPLLKQELQCKIQVERLSRGECELRLGPEPPKTYKLRPDEIEKRNNRLEQNRKSAKKSRLRAKSNEKNLIARIKKEMREHAELTKNIASLIKRRDELKLLWDDHVAVCPIQQVSTSL